MSRSARIFILGALLLLQPLANLEAQSAMKVDIRAVMVDFPNIAVDFRVKDGNGQDVTDLEERSIHIVEDDTTIITNFTLDHQIADADTPARTLDLSDGKKVEEIYATGATIGVVFDATTLLNSATSSDHDYIVEGRHAIEQFLLQTGAQAPRDPEVISLFLPTTSPDQQVQPVDFAEFTQDRNAVINYLRTMSPRTGKTNLYDVIQQAVETTARVAQQRGSEALVLVVSDGGDTISSDRFDRTMSQAQANRVRLVTFGIGADKNLIEQKGGFRLAQLAKTTGGLYVQRPDDAAASDAFRTMVGTTPAALYTARYSTALLDDGRKHRFVIQVTLPGGQATSQPVEFATLLNSEDVSHVIPPGTLLRQYLAIAVPVALLVSLLIVLLMGGIRWTRSQSMSRAQPSRRKGS